MKYKVFSVFDSKAEVFHQPMFMRAVGEAVRAFQDEANKSSSAICQHASDYTLFEIGEWDDDKGLLTPLTTPRSLGLGTEFKNDDGLVRPGEE